MNTSENESSLNTNNTSAKVYEVPAAGSLGLLALGYRGLEFWRKKRAEADPKVDAKGSLDKKNNSKE